MFVWESGSSSSRLDSSMKGGHFGGPLFCWRRFDMFTRARVVTVAFILATTPAFAAQLADQPSRRQAIELFRAGQEFMSAEQFERAADAFTKAKEKDPLLSIAHYGIGQANMNLRRY